MAAKPRTTEGIMAVKPTQADHPVKIWIEAEQFKYSKNAECLCVKGGETIEWKFRSLALPFGIVIKAPVSPVNWSYKMTEKGGAITATVLKNAAPGIYRYGVVAWNGSGLIFDDPEIIIKPPKGGRG